LADHQHLFWDSAVFNAYLYDQSSAYDVASIRQFLEDAKTKQLYTIYASSISIAEVLSSKIILPGLGSMTDFLNDFVGHIIVVDPSPNIMQLTGRLRDIPYRKGESDKRVLTTPDGIMLATCLNLEDAFGVKLDIFHTFDDGKKRGSVPLLSYHEWCDGLTGENDRLAKRVCAIKRERPVHPTPPLPGFKPPESS
jgi:hypothetical protein